METTALSVAGKLAVGGTEPIDKKGPADQAERLQESALAVLTAASSYLGSDYDLPSFFTRLSETVGQQTGAQRAAFWRLGPRGTLSVQPVPYGFADGSPIHSARMHLEAGAQGAMQRMIFDGELEVIEGTSPGLDAAWRLAGLTDIKNSIAASWRAGRRPLGAVSAFDSERGFSTQDVWVLQLAGIAAGMVWQLIESEDELSRTAVRLEEAMAARRALLNNIAAGGDEARRRFASALHDDSLQLLTAAELQLERVRAESDRRQAAHLDELRKTLRKVEDSLRGLLINVSPEPLRLPGDLREAISERLESMRIHSGIEPHIDTRLPDGVPDAIQTIVLKNIGEALTNVEKHARATKVMVVAEPLDGGVRVQVNDDGTGFVVAESLRMPGHIGLVAMRERAQLAGGWCRVRSEPGTGTTIDFWIPMSL